jgi:toxin HigB-1
MRAKPWELPDGLWQRIEPLLPLRRRRYLRMVDEARSIRDLRSPPANHLEALRGNRVGQHSVRINDQWRVCFRWSEERREAADVEITDYH